MSRRSSLIVVGAIVGFLGLAWGGAQLYTGYRLNQMIARSERNTPDVVIKYRSHLVQPWKLNWVVKDVDFFQTKSGFGVHADKVTLGWCDLRHEISRYCDYEVEGVTLNSSKPEIEDALIKIEKTLGIPIRLHIVAKHRYNPSKNHGVDSKMDLDQPGLFSANFSFNTAGVDLEKMTETLRQSMLAMQSQGTELGQMGAMVPMFSMMAVLGQIQLQDITMAVKLDPFLSEKVAKHTADMAEGKNASKMTPELVAFLKSPESAKVMVHPAEQNKSLSDLISLGKSTPQFVEIFGVKMELNGKPTNLAAMLGGAKPAPERKIAE